MLNATERFSSRVEDYRNFRPHYPREVLATLCAECGLTPSASIADIGSGTGCLTELFLENGNPVFAVEPNRDMRAAGQEQYGKYPGLHSVDGTAEATTLPDQCVDSIVSGQAFHWFDLEAAHAEFLRILRPGGWVMIVWNDRERSTTPFMIAYDRLLSDYSSEYAQVDHRKAYATPLQEFYGPAGFEARTFRYVQYFDFTGLKGRLLSSSYTPAAGHSNHEPMMQKLAAVYQEHQRGDRIEFIYTTRMYFGHLR